MVFKTRKDAEISLKCTFIQSLWEKHEIVKATINGKFVGWMLVFHPEK